jgi:hypothetical protein
VNAAQTDNRAEELLASPLGRQVIARYLPWKEEICKVSPNYDELAASWRGSRQGLLDYVIYSDWRNVPEHMIELAFRLAVRQSSGWKGKIADASEGYLIEGAAEECSAFGFSIEDEAVWSLTATGAGELRPVADALVAATGSQPWWAAPMLSDQRFVAWDDRQLLRGHALAAAVIESTRALRDENSADAAPSASRVRSHRDGYGSRWWSSPPFAERSWSANALEGLWSIGLLDTSDAYGPADPAERIENGEGPTLWRLRIDPSSRIFEVNGVVDWQVLVNQFPCDVSATHGKAWSRWTGSSGPWLLPDWENVRGCYDGVHVSVGAYLSSCGIAVPVRDGYSMLAGWMPGATLWLRDKITKSQKEPGSLAFEGLV